MIISIGECMVELARGHDGRFGLAYGGDTFNTAVYLARTGQRVAYATALGDDGYSDGIVKLAADEGVSTELVNRVSGRMPGLYLIETTAAGERTFHYWRESSPARELFDGAYGATVAAAMKAARLVCFSGITLSLYSPAGLDRFTSALAAARSAGARIAMDGNYRPRGWGGDAARACGVMERFWRLADVALPTFDDEAALWRDATPAATIARLAGFGVGEIVVKNGRAGAIVLADGARRDVPCPDKIAALDTTAAGDSFNAGYLARRLAGDSAVAAAVFGHRLAGVVIQHRGAIVPRAATATVTDQSAHRDAAR